MDVKKKVNDSQSLYISHIEAMQNVVRLHKACSNAGLEEISTVFAANKQSVEEFLGAESVEANAIFNELDKSLSSQQGELAIFSSDLRQKFAASIDISRNISKYIYELVDNLIKEAKQLESHASDIDEVQTKSITDFQKAYEEQSISDADKLIADMINLVSSHICHQKELVNAKLVTLKETFAGNKEFLDKHLSSMDGITTDTKRKWQEFSVQAGNDVKDCSDFSASKLCRMELLLQESVDTNEKASKYWKKTHESMTETGRQNASTLSSHVRNILTGNEQQDAEIVSATSATADDATKSSEDLIHHITKWNGVARSIVANLRGEQIV